MSMALNVIEVQIDFAGGGGSPAMNDPLCANDFTGWGLFALFMGLAVTY